MIKKCRKCGKEKSLEDYYVHPQMSDGHLNICKECTKRRIRNRSRSPEGRAYERKRNQTPQRKKWHKQYQRKRREMHRERFRAGVTVCRAVKKGDIVRPNRCSECGTIGKVQGHHEDYSKPLEVIWLCGECHRKRHKQYQRIDN